MNHFAQTQTSFSEQTSCPNPKTFIPFNNLCPVKNIKINPQIRLNESYHQNAQRSPIPPYLKESNDCSITPSNFISDLENCYKNVSTLQSLKNNIRDICAEHKIPYRIRDSKDFAERQFIHYQCRFKTCSSYFKLTFRDYKFSQIICNWEHNHSLDELFISANFLLMKTSEKEEIRELRFHGASPGFVRSKFNLSISPQQLYNIARKEILQRYDNEIQKLHDAAESWNNDFYVIFHENDKVFGGITLINRRIASTTFASDIVVIDDTMCTNKYKFPVVPCFCIDDNNQGQLLAIGIIIGKTIEDFCQILEDVKSYVLIRVFICDRLESQKSAIERVFPEAIIVFCRVHLERNIREACGNGSRMHRAIIDLFHGTIQTSDFVKILDSEIRFNDKAKNHLLLLKKHLQYYDPEKLFNKCLRKHYTSNLAEGLFGRIKSWLDNKITPMVEILNCFIREAMIMMKRNIKSEPNVISPEIYTGKKLGSLATEILTNVHKKLMNELEKSISGDSIILLNQECHCIEKYEFNLPCIHDFIQRMKLHQRPLFTEIDIPEIYFKCDLGVKQSTEIKVLEPKNKSNIKYTYQNIIDMVIPIAAEAEKNPNVQQLFINLFEKFSEMKLPNFGSPPSLQTPGRQITRQSKFVDHFSKKNIVVKKNINAAYVEAKVIIRLDVQITLFIKYLFK